MLPYGSRLRESRKQFHTTLGSKGAMSKFDSLQEVEGRRFLLRTMKDPSNLLQHLRT